MPPVNLLHGVPLWLSDRNVADGKRINEAAFSVPTGPVQGNLGRNARNGFGATEVDLTLRRQFKLYECLSRQARADFFNIFNHPNFGPPMNYMTSIRSDHPDARSLARQRRAERRTESPLPDRRSSLGATGTLEVDQRAVLGRCAELSGGHSEI